METRSQQIKSLHEQGLDQPQIAKIIGCNQSTVSRHLARIRQNTDAFGPPKGFDVVRISQSYDADGVLKSQTERSEPEIKDEVIAGEFKNGMFAAPLSMFADKVTSQYGGDGELRNQWVKAKVDPELRQIEFRAMFEAMSQDLPREPLSEPPSELCDIDMMSSYVVGDAHVGMLAWGKECGIPFDLVIAERELKGAIDFLVDRAPHSSLGLIVDVGDFMHANGRKNITPQSGALLDVDSRFPKARHVAVRVMRHMINSALRKHDTVKVICAPGNHNPDGAGWMSELLAVKYEDDPRVIVDLHPGAYFYHQWGKCLIGVTHGDTCKFDELPAIMAYDQPELWGQTKWRHFLTGHIHHTVQKEFRGVFCEAFNTMAPKDGWHAMSGYRSEQQMQRIDFHCETGEYSRSFVKPDMLKNGKNSTGAC